MCCLYQIEISALARALHDFSESHFVYPSFWCVSIVLEVH